LWKRTTLQLEGNEDMPFDKDYQEIKDKFETCSDHMEKLNDYEQHFIESNLGLFEEYGRLTPRQLEVLDQIYDKVK
jgi:hypothetical protein